MLNLTLPASSIPKWGAMLSDQDFLSAVRQTIQPKLELATGDDIDRNTDCLDPDRQNPTSSNSSISATGSISKKTKS